jgi:uncharacterized protein YdhG (YjbR/CyaY superfamily)
MNNEVKGYIEKQKSPQKEILENVRKIFLNTIPNCDEKMAWGVVTFAEKKFYIAALKHHVNIGFAVNGLSKEEADFFEGTGKAMRHIKVEALEDIDEKELVKLIKLVNKKAVCKPC